MPISTFMICSLPSFDRLAFGLPATAAANLESVPPPSADVVLIARFVANLANSSFDATDCGSMPTFAAMPGASWRASAFALAVQSAVGPLSNLPRLVSMSCRK
ncbi:hypothetical protein D3C86_1820690 [compost metagenome]